MHGAADFCLLPVSPDVPQLHHDWSRSKQMLALLHVDLLVMIAPGHRCADHFAGKVPGDVVDVNSLALIRVH